MGFKLTHFCFYSVCQYVLSVSAQCDARLYMCASRQPEEGGGARRLGSFMEHFLLSRDIEATAKEDSGEDTGIRSASFFHILSDVATNELDAGMIPGALKKRNWNELFPLRDLQRSVSHKKVPQFMKDLYDAVADSDGMIKNSRGLDGNVVRSFAVYIFFAGQTNGVFHFFNLTSFGPYEKIIKAEFRWFRRAQPFLLGHHFHKFASSGQNSESSQGFPESKDSLQALKRRRRSTRGSPSETAHSETCQRTPLYVDFAKIGWSGWIISPRGYNAYHCVGSCPFPLSGSLRATNHAIVQSIVNTLKLSSKVERPCCVPDVLYPISLLYFDDEENVVLKQYDDMVAGNCACN
ncbi:hypothetical protein P4O66_011200 [Electrophorus voltai]|uniref:TGF-beta family profile domain-containing protein n=1 Tax=Electrophorus voltai TaxID=2609070 RepID=A0AAD8Z8D1_9TELE|nr:hypothetical protein P4O66_011200 [Electrophorus voltai]